MGTDGTQIEQAVEGRGHIFSATGDVHVVQHIQPAVAADRRNLDILRENVKHFWIDNVLDKSLHQVAAIELGKAIEKEAVDHPWDMVVSDAGSLNQSFTGNESIGSLFDSLGKALLILGAPGSGKTTSLLELAKNRISLAESDPAQPIPVIFNLSTWSPQSESLQSWLISEMATKYSVNRTLTKPWIENQWLLPLLDGLDEVSHNHRSKCLDAINSFTQEVGVPGIAVCCREAEYNALPGRLRASGAIRLKPLTPVQIEQHLLACGPRLTPLRNSLKEDNELMAMAESPLMLSIMCLAHSDGADIKLPPKHDSGSLDRRHMLFDTYIDRMFHRRGKKEQAPFDKEFVTGCLGSLASLMAHHSQTEFHGETLQPNWLTSNKQRWLYLILTNVIGGLSLVGLLGVLFFPYLDQSLLEGVKIVFFLALFYIVSGALMGAMRFRMWRGFITFTNKNSFWSVFLNIMVLALGVCVILTIFNFILVEKMRPLEKLSSFVGATWVLGLLFGFYWWFRGRQRTIGNDIRTFEALNWSWRKAKKGGLVGASIMIAYFTWNLFSTDWNEVSYQIKEWILAFIVLSVLTALWFAIGAIFGGLSTRREIDYKLEFNKGMHLTLRNGLLMALIFIGLSVVWFLIYISVAYSVAELKGTDAASALKGALTLGGILATYAFFWFGGIDLIQHGVLRFLLKRTIGLPLRCNQFLRYSADLIFMQRVGGGYRFIHQMVRDHFAIKSTQLAYVNGRSEQPGESGLRIGLKTSPLFVFLIFSLIYGAMPAFRHHIASWVGDNRAMFELGAYYEDMGLDIYMTEALHYYSKAADLGEPDAQFAIGRFYHLGKGVSVDIDTARTWYIRAAEQGHGKAQLELAKLKSSSMDLPVHHPDVMNWYQLAAENGIAEAQFVVATIYHTTSEHYDIQEAEKWYRLAVAQGHTGAIGNLGWLLVETKRWDEALEITSSAAENGVADAQFVLGYINHTSTNHHDVLKAEKWYRLAAAQGHVGANGNLGWLLIQTKRWDEALEATTLAHNTNPDEPAWIINLANLKLLRGNRSEAERLYLKALPLIQTRTQLELGLLSDLDLFIENGWQIELCIEMKDQILRQWEQSRQ